MPKIDIPIANGFYVSDALPISAQRCVNFYPNQPQTQAITAGNLFNTQGLTLALDLSNLDDVSRGAHTVSGTPFFVIGTKLYQINYVGTTFSETLIGTVDGIDRVAMADNGDQLCIVARPDDITSGKSYIYDIPSTTFAEITDVNFDGPASDVVYIDGLFVFSKASGTKFFNSPTKDGRGLPSGTAYDALDFSQAEADPDKIRSLAVSRSQLYVIGDHTTQIFRNAGRSPAPFVGLQGGVIDVGLDAIDSIQRVSSAICFVGSAFNESASVWMVEGSSKSKISTTALDNEISKLTDDQLAAISSDYFASDGHFFYSLSFPLTTYVYDLVTQLWHERQSVDGLVQAKSRASDVTAGYGFVLTGDNQDGKIGYFDETNYTEYDYLQRRFITTQPFDNTGNPIRVSQIELVIESGVGLTADVQLKAGTDSAGNDIMITGGYDPKVTLFWSDDGARTFVGNLSRSMGKIGQYLMRPIWYRIGRFPRSRVIMFEVSSPTKATLIKAEANVSG